MTFVIDNRVGFVFVFFFSLGQLSSCYSNQLDLRAAFFPPLFFTALMKAYPMHFWIYCWSNVRPTQIPKQQIQPCRHNADNIPGTALSSNHLSVCGINIKVTVLGMTLKAHKELTCVRGQVNKDAPARYTRKGTYPAAVDNRSAENKHCSQSEVCAASIPLLSTGRNVEGPRPKHKHTHKYSWLWRSLITH